MCSPRSAAPEAEPAAPGNPAASGRRHAQRQPPGLSRACSHRGLGSRACNTVPPVVELPTSLAPSPRPTVAASLNLTTPDTAEVPETPAPPRPVEAEPVTQDPGHSRSAHHPADPGSDNSDSSNHGGTSGDNAGTRQHL